MLKMPDSATTTKQKVLAGIILVALGVTVFVFTRDKTATCALGTAGVLAISEGVAHGEGTARIVADAAVPVACEAVVSSLVSDPSKQVTINLQTPTGTSTQTISGTSVTEPAPTPTTGAGRIIQCIISYGDSRFLTDACEKGIIEPK